MGVGGGWGGVTDSATGTHFGMTGSAAAKEFAGGSDSGTASMIVRAAGSSPGGSALARTRGCSTTGAAGGGARGPDAPKAGAGVASAAGESPNCQSRTTCGFSSCRTCCQSENNHGSDTSGSEPVELGFESLIATEEFEQRVPLPSASPASRGSKSHDPPGDWWVSSVPNGLQCQADQHCSEKKPSEQCPGCNPRARPERRIHCADDTERRNREA